MYNLKLLILSNQKLLNISLHLLIGGRLATDAVIEIIIFCLSVAIWNESLYTSMYVCKELIEKR